MSLRPLLKPSNASRRFLTTYAQTPNHVPPSASVCSIYRLPSLPQGLPLRFQRSFSNSLTLHKKGGKAARDQAKAESAGAPADDPNDFSVLEADITKLQDKLKEELGKLRPGGRFNPQLVEDIRVTIDKENPKHTVRLGDLAQVIPRGRTLNLMVGEQDFLKPIKSAVQNSNLNLTPQNDGQNPLQLNVPLPPPTAEARQQVVQTAVKAGETANKGVRDARQAAHKKLQAMQKNKTALADDVRKAENNLAKLVERATADVKKVVDASKKVLESA